MPTSSLSGPDAVASFAALRQALTAWPTGRVARLFHGPPTITRKKTMKSLPHPKPPARRRVVLAVAAVAAAAAQFIVVTAAFDDVSREPFLRDTAPNRLAVARCDAQGAREARHQCVRRLVAAAKASDAGVARLAAAEATRQAE